MVALVSRKRKHPKAKRPPDRAQKRPIVLTDDVGQRRLTDRIYPPGYVPLTMHNPDWQK